MSASHDGLKGCMHWSQCSVVAAFVSSAGSESTRTQSLFSTPLFTFPFALRYIILFLFPPNSGHTEHLFIYTEIIMTKVEEGIKLDFKDVLLKPKRSTLKSRADVSLNSFSCPSIRLMHCPCLLILCVAGRTGSYVQVP